MLHLEDEYLRHVWWQFKGNYRQYYGGPSVTIILICEKTRSRHGDATGNVGEIIWRHSHYPLKYGKQYGGRASRHIDLLVLRFLSMCKDQCSVPAEH